MRCDARNTYNPHHLTKSPDDDTVTVPEANLVLTGDLDTLGDSVTSNHRPTKMTISIRVRAVRQAPEST